MFRLQTEFIKEGFSNSVVTHEENFENNSVVDVNADTIDIEDKTIQTNSTTVPQDVYKFCFYDDPRAQMGGGALNVWLLIILLRY